MPRADGLAHGLEHTALTSARWLLLPHHPPQTSAAEQSWRWRCACSSPASGSQMHSLSACCCACPSGCRCWWPTGAPAQ